MKRFKNHLIIAAVFAGLAIAGLMMNSHPVSASAGTPIVGPGLHPLPVTILNLDEPGRIPYQTTIGGDARSENAPILPQVPSGKRLVIKDVSFRLLSNSTAGGSVSMELLNPSVEYNFPLTFVASRDDGNDFTGNFSVTAYVDPTTTVQFLANETAITGTLLATVSGYLIDCNAASPCAAYPFQP